jgi:hypothetical protein
MISGIHVSSSEIVIQKGENRKNPLPLFVKDQVVHAKVLELLPQGSARLLINKRTVTAKTPMLLKLGEEIQLKVLEEKEGVLLKFMGPAQKITTSQISSLIRFFPGNESLADVSHINIPRVKNLLHELALKSGKADPSFLPTLIEKIGLTLENKTARLLLQEQIPLSNLKQTASVLLNQDVKALIQKEVFMAGPNPSESLNMAASFSETLENFQILNQHSSESGRFLLPFPVFSEDVFRFGQLFIDTGGRKNKEESSADRLIRISFLLDMTLLGPLRADFSVLKKEISGRFLLNDEDACQYVRSMIPELRERLNAIDYKVHEIDCVLGDKIRLQPVDFIEALLESESDRVLNIVI